MDADEKKLVEDAINLLRSQASHDECYCNKDDGCSIDTPSCDAMRARAAKRTLERAVDPYVRSLHPNRLTNPTERTFFEYWQNGNERQPGLNHGYTTLEWILCPPGHAWPDRPSQRDMDVATAVVQWLGTNCGGGMIHECERRIAQERAERSVLEQHVVVFGDKERDLFDRVCDKILGDLIPDPKHADSFKLDKYGLSYFRARVRELITTLFTLFAIETGKISIADAAPQSGYGLERMKKLHELARKSVEQRVKSLEERKARKKVGA